MEQKERKVGQREERERERKGREEAVEGGLT